MMSKAWPTPTSAQTAPRSEAATAAVHVYGQSAPVAAVEKLIHRWQRWRAMRQTITALSGLEGHVLEDIGITRGDIPSVAKRLADQTW